MYKDIVTLKKGAQPENFDDVVIENWRYSSLHTAQNDSLHTLSGLGVLVYPLKRVFHSTSFSLLLVS